MDVAVMANSRPQGISDEGWEKYLGELRGASAKNGKELKKYWKGLKKIKKRRNGRSS
ncbi:MAG: hypothetical protein G01um101420_397 [Parcubacteria group bacterium Gr01-1014_20]|nr:MAG: hypothetical protein G01um101420_397 [Parcubacteria group bacterium Gr01-1014_20]